MKGIAVKWNYMQTIEAKTTLDINKQEVENITGSEAVLKALLAEGVDTIFGYPGGQGHPEGPVLYLPPAAPAPRTSSPASPMP